MSEEQPNHMQQELAEIPSVVERQLVANVDVITALCAHIKASRPQYAVTIARGSSDHAANFAKYLFESELAMVTASASPSIVTLYQKTLQASAAMVIGFSQSGKSPDICETMQAMRASGAITIAFVNVVDSPLAKIAEYVIPMQAGPELSVAATKSFVANLSALLQFVAVYNGDNHLSQALLQLPDFLRQAKNCDDEAIVERLTTVSTLFTLGRGYGYPIAQEMALKFKETAIIHAESYSGADMLHGPIAVVKQQNPVLTLCQQDACLPATLELLAKLQTADATNILLYPKDSKDLVTLQQYADLSLVLPPALHPLCDPLIAIQAFYPLVEALARKRGFDPDVPPFLNKVTKTL